MTAAAIRWRISIRTPLVTFGTIKVCVASFERKINVFDILTQEGHRFSFDFIVKYKRQ